MKLSGKVAIVTGAGGVESGWSIGQATAHLFAKEGAFVAVWDKNEAAAALTVAQIEKFGGTAKAFIGDVTENDTVAAVIDRVADLWGKIDILQNTVGIGGFHGKGSVVSAAESSWDLVMSTNVKSIMLTGKHVIPIMAEAGSGTIINLASIAASHPTGLTPYSTSKGAIVSLTKCMAVDHGRQGIRVNAVAPGLLYTPMAAAKEKDAGFRAKRRDVSPLNIEGSAWDSAETSLFLASDAARFITGQTIYVDGGLSLTRRGLEFA